MGVIKKEGIKQSAIIYIGVFIGTANTLYFYPKFFDPDELGLFRFLIEASLLLFPILSLGVHNLAVRMFPIFKSEKNGHNGLLGLLMYGVAVGYVLFLLLTYIFQSFIVSYLQSESLLIQQFWYFIVPLAGLTIFSTICNLYVLNFKKVVFPTIFEDLYLKLGLPIIGILIYFGYLSIVGGVYCLVGIYFFRLLSFLFYIYWIKEWHWRPNWNMLKPPLIKEMTSFSLYGILGSLGSMVANRIDVLMVALLATNELKDAAIFTIAMFIANIIAVPAKAINNIASPVISESWKNNDVDNIQDIYAKSSTVLLTIGLFVFIGIWCSVDDLFTLMPNGDIYANGKFVILILGIGKLFDLATGVNEQIITYSKYFRFNFYAVLILAVANIIANTIFIPIFQINGAALATMSSIVIYNISKLIFIKYKIRIHPFSKDTLKVLGIGSVVLLIGLSIPALGIPLVDIILRSAAITILFVSSVLYFKVSEDLNNLYFQFINTVKKAIIK
jgi:O-antigen/teichoic acid export membrane protein